MKNRVGVEGAAFCSVALRFEAVVSQQESGHSGGDFKAFLGVMEENGLSWGRNPVDLSLVTRSISVK